MSILHKKRNSSGGGPRSSLWLPQSHPIRLWSFDDVCDISPVYIQTNAMAVVLVAMSLRTLLFVCPIWMVQGRILSSNNPPSSREVNDNPDTSRNEKQHNIRLITRPFYSDDDDDIGNTNDDVGTGPSINTTTTSSLTPAIYQFRIMQLTDLHIGENSWDDWGPEQDRETRIAIEAYFEWEELKLSSSLTSTNSSSSTPQNGRRRNNHGIDLIVFTGDQITADNIVTNATAYYSMLGEWVDGYTIPWAVIFGNHDEAGFVPPDATDGSSRVDAVTRRHELMATVDSFDYSVIRLREGPIHSNNNDDDDDDNNNLADGGINYWLDVYFHDDNITDNGVRRRNQSSAVAAAALEAASILLLDTGGGSYLPERIDRKQLEWINQTAPSSDIPIVAFQHIPGNDWEYDPLRCTGSFDDSVSPLQPENDAGIVTTLLEMGNVHFLSVGHDHGNSLCCAHNGTHRLNDVDGANAAVVDDIPNSTSSSSSAASSSTNTNDSASMVHLLHTCYGRHSGHGGYGGNWEKGVRIYTLLWDRNKSFLGFDVYTRLESGYIQDEYSSRLPLKTTTKWTEECHARMQIFIMCRVGTCSWC